MRTVLLMLSQCPHDPASGAARVMRTVCELLASPPSNRSGKPLYEPSRVVAVATTATEAREPLDAPEFLREAGLSIHIQDQPGARVITALSPGGAEYRLLDTGPHNAWSWEPTHEEAFERLFARTLDQHRPDALFFFGERQGEVRRALAARAAGAAVVFALQNLAYHNPRSFDHVDAVITPSRFAADVYRRRLGIACTPILPPMVLGDVLVPPADRAPDRLVFVNPVPEKGLMLFIALADLLGERRPDIRILLIESRGGADDVLRAAASAGVDLARHPSIEFARRVPRPRDFLAVARALIAPSIVEETAGLVVGESLVNGIPPIVSPRGALPETAGAGGFVLPLPPALLRDPHAALAAADVAPWAALVERLWDSRSFYDQCAARAKTAGKPWLPAAVAPRYAEVFASARRGAGVFAGPPANP